MCKYAWPNFTEQRPFSRLYFQNNTWPEPCVESRGFKMAAGGFVTRLESVCVCVCVRRCFLSHSLSQIVTWKCQSCGETPIETGITCLCHLVAKFEMKSRLLNNKYQSRKSYSMCVCVYVSSEQSRFAYRNHAVVLGSL